MRQLTYLGAGQVDWTEVPDPSFDPVHGALLRPLAVARCDLDARMITDALFPGPFPVGHETVAEVVAVGDAVRKHRPGDRVLVPFQPSCGACRECAGGCFAACRNYRAPAGAAFGFGNAGGGHGGAVADLLPVPHADHLLVGAPHDVPVEVLCTLPDNVGDGFRTVAPYLHDRPGADVLVVGGTAPSVGLYAVLAAVALGADSVRYVDTDEQRCVVAAELGAMVEVLDGSWPRRFPRASITVNNTDDPDGLAATLRSTEPYGICTCTAIFFGSPPRVPMLDLYTRGITLHVCRTDSRAWLPPVLDHVVAGTLPVERVSQVRVGWEQAPQAWLAPATKLVLVRD